MELTVILSDAWVTAPAGTARYGVQLANALASRAPAGWQLDGFVHRVAAARRAALREQVPDLRTVRSSTLDRRLLGWAWETPAALPPPGDVVFAPSLFAPIAAVARRGRSRLIVTVHDLVPFTHPETLSPHGVRWHRRQIERARRWADAIIVPSEAVADAVEHYAPVGTRLHVVPGAASPQLLHATSATGLGVSDDPYMLFVGTIEPRKGLDLLVAALAHPALATASTRSLRLVVVGADGWGGVDVFHYARGAGADIGRMRVTGRVDDGELAALIRGAVVLVAPSRAEGFGLPVVEAMSLGTPVIHSLDAALSETAAGAGIGVDLSGDVDSAVARLAAAIARVTTEPVLRARLVGSGLVRAADFSWPASADLAWKVIGG